MADRKMMLRGETGDGERLFACVDPEARYTNSQTCRFAFSAALAPFKSEAEARAALATAGVASPEEVRR